MGAGAGATAERAPGITARQQGWHHLPGTRHLPLRGQWTDARGPACGGEQHGGQRRRLLVPARLASGVRAPAGKARDSLGQPGRPDRCRPGPQPSLASAGLLGPIHRDLWRCGPWHDGVGPTQLAQGCAARAPAGRHPPLDAVPGMDRPGHCIEPAGRALGVHRHGGGVSGVWRRRERDRTAGCGQWPPHRLGGVAVPVVRPGDVLARAQALAPASPFWLGGAGALAPPCPPRRAGEHASGSAPAGGPAGTRGDGAQLPGAQHQRQWR